MKPQIEKINQISQFFKEPIKLPYEKIENKSTQVLEITKESNFKSITPDVKSFSTKYPELNIKSKLFFITIKPKGSIKGTRLIFFYCSNYYSIFNSEKNELELLPHSTKFYRSNRNLIIENKNQQRFFTIKINLQTFEGLINNSNSNTITQFLLSSLATSQIPPLSHLTLPFFNLSIYNLTFLTYFTLIPSNLLNNSIYISWIRASDPFLDEILDNFFQTYFKSIDEINFQIPNNIFYFEICKYILFIDDNYQNFINNLIKKKKNLIETYMLLISNEPFNERSKLMLHLLFNNIYKEFSIYLKSKKIINSFLIENLSLILKEKSINFDLNQLDLIKSFSFNNLNNNLILKYNNFLNKLKIQPPNYLPAKKGINTLESFSNLLNFSFENILIFLDIYIKSNFI